MKKVYYTFWEDNDGIRHFKKKWHGTKAEAQKHLKELESNGIKYAYIDSIFKSEWKQRHIICGNFTETINPEFSPK